MVVVLCLFVTVLAVFVGGWLFVFLVLSHSVCVCLWCCSPLPSFPTACSIMFVHCGVCVPLLHPPPCVFVAVVVVVRCFH